MGQEFHRTSGSNYPPQLLQGFDKRHGSHITLFKRTRMVYLLHPNQAAVGLPDYNLYGCET